MAKYSMTGIVDTIFPEEQISDKFRKQEFILIDEDDEKSKVKFECANNNIKELEGVQEGDGVKVEFYINGKEWRDKHFVNLSCTGIVEA